MDLSVPETRVLGCLLEKQLTTPDVYPLTLNSLRLACNQSTNRDPVVDYDEATLRRALHRLERRGYVRLASGQGSRAAKYRHLLAEALPLSGDEHAVVCVLMLRGPQTPGELKQRAGRMHPFAGLHEVRETLTRLIARELVGRLDRRPGQKEERYEHLLGADGADDVAPVGAAASVAASPAAPAAAAPPAAPQGPNPLAAPHGDPPADVSVPIGDLQERVTRLEREVAALRARLAGPAVPGGEPEPDERAPATRGATPAPAARGAPPVAASPGAALTAASPGTAPVSPARGAPPAAASDAASAYRR